MTGRGGDGRWTFDFFGLFGGVFAFFPKKVGTRSRSDARRGFWPDGEEMRKPFGLRNFDEDAFDAKGMGGGSEPGVEAD